MTRGKRRESLALNCEGNGTLTCPCRMCSAVRETLERITEEEKHVTEQRNTADFTTVSGRLVHLDDLKPSDISIWDIAHSLSRLCRYAGHIGGFYSVAEHSVLVARLVAQEKAVGIEGQRYALLHDAHEAYLGDMIGPLKKLLRRREVFVIDELESQIDAVIRERYALPEPSEGVRHIVKKADYEALLMEQTQLRLIDSAAHLDHVERGRLYGGGRGSCGLSEGGVLPEGLKPSEAFDLFLKEFKKLAF